MYPDYPAEPHAYYGPKAARYLRNLALLRDVKNISKALIKAIDEGLKMSEDASKAYRLPWPPKDANNCEEAYAVFRFNENQSAREAALALVRKQTRETGMPALNNPYLGGAVYMRSEFAYAAAVLLRANQGADRARALALANEVLKDLGDEGRLYSTVD